MRAGAVRSLIRSPDQYAPPWEAFLQFVAAFSRSTAQRQQLMKPRSNGLGRFVVALAIWRTIRFFSTRLAAWLMVGLNCRALPTLMGLISTPFAPPLFVPLCCARYERVQSLEDQRRLRGRRRHRGQIRVLAITKLDVEIRISVSGLGIGRYRKLVPSRQSEQPRWSS